MSLEVTSTAPSANREIVKAWTIFGISTLTAVVGIVIPFVFLIAIALLIASVVILRKTNQKNVRTPLIASIAVVSAGFILMIVTTVSVFMS